MSFLRKITESRSGRIRNDLRRAFRPAPDGLEGRQLLAATVTLDGATLRIDADNAASNQVLVQSVVGQLRVSVVAGGATTTRTFNEKGISAIAFNGGTGANAFTNLSRIPATVRSNGKGDAFSAGSGGDTYILNSSSASIDASNGFAKIVASSERFFTLTDTSLVTPTGAYTLRNVKEAVLTLAGPNAQLGGQTINLRGFSGKATVNSQGAVRTDYILGTGPTSIAGGSGLNVLTVENIRSATLRGSSLVVNGVASTIQNITNINASNAGGVNNTIDLDGFAGATFITLARPGNAIVRGGSGPDTIVGTAGTNLVLPSAGNDIVSGANVSRFAGISGVPVPGARRNAAPTAPISALLQPGGVLDVVGPTGVGFSLAGNWSVATSPTGEQALTASGNVVLRTAAGEIPFTVPASSPIGVSLQGAFAGFGSLVSANLRGLVLDTSDPSGPLNPIEARYGIHVEAAGATWGLALGKDLPGIDRTAIASAVPYLFATATSGASASFGGRSVSASTGSPLTIAFDPSDPSIVAQAGGFKVGGSVGGVLPFNPSQDLFQILTRNPVVFGQVYTSGVNPARPGAALDLGDLPFVATGDAVIHLDPKGTRAAGAINPEVVRGVVSGQVALSDVFADGLDDVAVGVNGGVRAGYTGSSANDGVIDLDLTLNTPVASLAYAPGGLNFAGTTTTIESGLRSGKATPLAYLSGAIQSFKGSVGGNVDPAFRAEALAKFGGSLGALLPGGAGLVFRPRGVEARAVSAPVPGFGAIGLGGEVRPNGDLILGGESSTTVAITAGDNFIRPFDLLTNPPRFTLKGRLNLSFAGATAGANPISAVQVSIDPMNIPSYVGRSAFFTPREEVRLSGDFTPTFLTSGATTAIQWQGGGQIAGTLIEERKPFGTVLETRRSALLNAWQLQGNQIVSSFSPTFNPNGKKFTYTLNSAAFPGLTVTPRIKAGKAATLKGRVGSPDPNSTWTLRINWGDGSAEQTVVLPKGSDGRRVRLAHRFLRPSPAGSPYRVLVRWQDGQGRGNAQLLSVRAAR